MTGPKARKADALRTLGLERAGRFKTFLRLVVLPDVHPWNVDRRGSWRLPAALFASVLFLIFVAASGCTTVQVDRTGNTRALRGSGALSPAEDAICSTVFADMVVHASEEEDAPQPAVFEVELPEAPSFAQVTISSTTLPPDTKLTVRAAGTRSPRALGQLFEVDLHDLGDHRKMIIEVPACTGACRLRVEAQAAFGARAALDVMLENASKSVHKLDRAFSEQTAFVAVDAREDVARARKALVFKPCKAPIAEAIAKKIETFVTGSADALEAMYGAPEPKLYDARALAETKGLEAYPALAAHVRAMAAIASEVPADRASQALYWLAVARAEKRESWIKLMERAPALGSLEDAGARIDLVRALAERSGERVALPMFDVAVRTPERSAIAGATSGVCYGVHSLIPGGDGAAALAQLRGWLSLGASEKLPVAGVEDVVRLGVTFQRAQRILCELPIDVAPLDATLKRALDEQGLAGLQKALVPIRVVRSSLPAGSSLSNALSGAADRALCQAFEEKRIERAVRTVADYARYVGEAVEIFANAGGLQISCPKGQLTASSARRLLARRYQHAFSELRGSPHELAEQVRAAFGLTAPHLARVAPPDSIALDYPPVFEPTAKQLEAWQKGCDPAACFELSALVERLEDTDQIKADVCEEIPEKPSRPTKVEVGSPGLVTPLELKCLSSEEFDLELDLQRGAGRALLVRSRQQFKIAGIQTTERHKQRDLKLGWVYTIVLDLEDRQMFGTEKKITIKPSSDEQAIFWSTTRTPEL